MKTLAILTLLSIPTMLGCSGNRNIKIYCEGAPATSGKLLYSNYGFYVVTSDADGKTYHIPVSKCILQEEQE